MQFLRAICVSIVLYVAADMYSIRLQVCRKNESLYSGEEQQPHNNRKASVDNIGDGGKQ